ncbi:MAG: lasso RiPP family leader peptide-containing protein [Erythrobacter sp.]
MTKEAKKSKYTTPRLTAFGSVRNLTGGSGTMGNDGGATMTMN